MHGAREYAAAVAAKYEQAEVVARTTTLAHQPRSAEPLCDRCGAPVPIHYGDCPRLRGM